jgi:hypothetical protein
VFIEKQVATSGRRSHAGFTLIELLEFILAAALAAWLAGRLASQCHGSWKTVVFCTVIVVGTAVFGFSILIGLAYVFEAVERRSIEGRTGCGPTRKPVEPEPEGDEIVRGGP